MQFWNIETAKQIGGLEKEKFITISFVVPITWRFLRILRVLCAHCMTGTVIDLLVFRRLPVLSKFLLSVFLHRVGTSCSHFRLPQWRIWLSEFYTTAFSRSPRHASLMWVPQSIPNIHFFSRLTASIVFRSLLLFLTYNFLKQLWLNIILNAFVSRNVFADFCTGTDLIWQAVFLQASRGCCIGLEHRLNFSIS